MSFTFIRPWHAFLPKEPGHVVSIMGSGGKTSLLKACADVYARAGQPVLLTTTTRSEPLPACQGLTLEALATTTPEDLPAVVYVYADRTDDGKWCGLDPQDVDQLTLDFPTHVILAEIDGSAGYPVKLYKAAEPCWPTTTSLALVCLGMSALQESAADVLHRVHCQHAPMMPDLTPDTTWTWDHYFDLLSGPKGYLDQIPAHLPTVLALTQMAQAQDTIGLFDFVARVMALPQFPLVMFCETTGDQPSFKTASIDGGC